jgi:hypothetical protein
MVLSSKHIIYKAGFIKEKSPLKETVSRDFRPLVFHKSIFEFCSEFAEIFAIMCYATQRSHDSPLCCIARSHDSPQCNIALSRLRPMQHSAEFSLIIFSIEIRLDCIARSSSAILVEKNSALCNLARSHDSALCCIAWSQNCIAWSQLTEL